MISIHNKNTSWKLKILLNFKSIISFYNNSFSFIILYSLITFTFLTTNSHSETNVKNKEPLSNSFGAIVINEKNGDILYKNNEKTELHPASLTKLMTLYILFQEIKLGNINFDSKFTTSHYASKQPSSNIGLKRGESINIKNAIETMITKSANDVAVVIAENIEGSEKAFAKRMNITAKKLGMKKTNFMNSSGLENKQQYSTPYDITILAARIYRDFPEYYPFFKKKYYFHKNSKVGYTNDNRLLWDYKGADGIKTGYIKASGYNIVASVQKNGERIIATIFGGKSSFNRNELTKNLIDKSFPILKRIEKKKKYLKEENKPPLKTIHIKELNKKSSSYFKNIIKSEKEKTQELDLAIKKGELNMFNLINSKNIKKSPPKKLTSSYNTEAQGSSGYRSNNQGEWSIQIGTYRDLFTAKSATAQAMEKMQSIDGFTFNIVKIEKNNQIIYKPQIYGFKKNSSQKACRIITKTTNLNCFEVSPG